MRTEMQDIIRDAFFKQEGERLVLAGRFVLTVCLPREKNAVDDLEAQVDQQGQELKREMFRLLWEKADERVTLQQRKGKDGQGIQLRGRRPYFLLTRFGKIRVMRRIVRHRSDGSYEFPSATAWGLPLRSYVTRGLRQGGWDAVQHVSYRNGRRLLSEQACQEKLLSTSTLWKLVQEEAGELREAGRQRAEAVLEQAEQAAALLPPPNWEARKAAADQGQLREFPPENAVQCVAEARGLAVGFCRREPRMEEMPPPRQPAVGEGEARPRREVDAGYVMVQADETPVKAQAHCGVKEYLFYTAVVLWGMRRWHVTASSAEQLWKEVAAFLCELRVPEGERKLLVLADGARWIRNWFLGLGLRGKLMILCWFHLVKQVHKCLTMGLDRETREHMEPQILKHLWKGEVEQAIAVLGSLQEQAKRWAWIQQLMDYLASRRNYIPNYQDRHQAGLWIASTAVETWNDVAISTRCKRDGTHWTQDGVMTMASYQTARQNEELGSWRGTAELPRWREGSTAQAAA